MNVVYVTGNEHKAKYFSEMVGLEIEHHPADTTEIQSLDPVEVITAKVKEAFIQIGKPVIVEDTSLIINAMGKLPGTFIKWFLDEIKDEGLCRLADTDDKRGAIASAIFAYYDGQNLKLIHGSLNGTITDHPKGESGFGWNRVFIPEGAELALGEMDDATFKFHYIKIKPFQHLREYLESVSVH